MKGPLLFAAITSCALAACSKNESARVASDSVANAPNIQSVDSAKRSNAMSLNVTSSAFTHGGSMPTKYTCEGEDTSPPLAWSGSPENTKSFALIVDDPDAPDPAKPQRVYVHWVVYNIPSTAKDLRENASNGGMPAGAVQGKNDWGKKEYGGPCPPIGRHRYFFKLYALDTTLSGLENPAKGDIEKAIDGHVLAKGELMGTYEKTKK